MATRPTKTILAIAFFLAATTAGHAVPKPEVSADYDKFFNFSALKTWAWHPAPPAHGYVMPPDAHALLKSMIEGHLAKAGMAQASQGTPDLWVYYDVTKENKTDRILVGHRPGDDGVDPWTERTYAAGTILLDFSDPKTNRTVWRGWILGELAPDLPVEKRKARVSEALTKLLKAFPR